MESSPSDTVQIPDVAALHDVLFAELGSDWEPSSPEEAHSLAEYKELRRYAWQSRIQWARLSAGKSSRSACERACEEMSVAEERCLAPLYSIFHSRKRSALCLSGGGIRSATFALGAIHALAKYSYHGEPGTEPPRLLAEFDYLSTVSGGGYIGSWFSSWIQREGSSESVIRQLACTPSNKLDPEPKPLRYLRDYSNYLNPRLGLFSADTWTLAATAIRNILLNWLVLIPFLAAALLLPELFQELLGLNRELVSSLSGFALATGFATAVIGTSFILYNLPSFGDGRNGEKSFLLFCLLPLIVSALAMTLWWGWQDPSALQRISPGLFALFGAAVHGLGVSEQ